MKTQKQRYPKTQVLVKLPEHRIVYTGIDAKEAARHKRVWKQEGRKVETQVARVTGSRTLKHYTVYVF